MSMHASFDRWWNGISLRAKITGVTVLLLTFGLTVAGAGTMTVLRTYLLDQTDQQIAAAYEKLPPTIDLATIEAYGDGTRLNPFYLAAVSSNGQLIVDNLSDEEEALLPDTSLLTTAYVAAHQHEPITLYNDSHSAQWRVIPYPAKVEGSSERATLLVGLNMNNTNGIIARYTVIFLGFAFAVVVFGAATTQLLVTSTFSPLRDVEATAARFAAGDYSQRLGGATPNTEVGRLNRSLNTMLARIDRAFADRERTVEQMRRFVGDASHELRTPLVSLRGYAELYRMGAIQDPDDVAQAMDRIEREAIRMGGLVEDLLELARLDEAKPLELAPVDLLPIAQDAALDASVSAPARRITVIVPEPATVSEVEAPVEEDGDARRGRRRDDRVGSPGIHHRVGEHARVRGCDARPPAPSSPGPRIVGAAHRAGGRAASRCRAGRARRGEQDPPGHHEPGRQRDALHPRRQPDRVRGRGRPRGRVRPDLGRRSRSTGCPRSCGRRSSSASGVPTPRARATPAGAGSGSPSSPASSATTTATSRCSRRRAAARPSGSAFPSCSPPSLTMNPPRWSRPPPKKGLRS